jgi:hypothetical protein
VKKKLYLKFFTSKDLNYEVKDLNSASNYPNGGLPAYSQNLTFIPPTQISDRKASKSGSICVVVK